MAKRGFCLLCCLLLLTGCYGKSALRVEKIFENIKGVVDLPRCEIYRYVTDQSHNRLLSRLYTNTDNTNTVPPALAFCDDYLICLGEGDEIWELHIFCTASVYDNKRIQEMLIKRRDLLQEKESFRYYSETSQTRVLGAEVFSFQNFVILSVTDQNEAIRALFQ